MQLGPRAVDMRAAETFHGLIPRPYSTSVIILTINVAIYLVMVAFTVHMSQQSVADALGDVWKGFSSQVLMIFGAKFGPTIYQYGQWWRLVTAGFLHGSLLHIGLNMWVMFELIAEVEQFYGWSRLILVYVGSTITGFFLSLVWDPMTVSIGASAACFGLIGAMMAIGLRRRADPMAQAIRHYYRRWAIYGLIFSFMPFMRIDIAAHLGGLAGGFVLGYIMGLPGLPSTPRERTVQTLAGLAVALTLYCFFQEFRFFAAIQSRLAG
ncbi:MAG TPA: rhomboid family intramembrane serine protease [Bryobacteraceae bacterium]|nr:rhomboid family intramembrane serine protease [Bryobacteraceae bacterium]